MIKKLLISLFSGPGGLLDILGGYRNLWQTDFKGANFAWWVYEESDYVPKVIPVKDKILYVILGIRRSCLTGNYYGIWKFLF